ncbi:serum paraoxonase/arylesterase [Leucosporidium creatinivorum]|uniref:Serum paraoxonase/arylesterase n=1 Tax=Leucosporidium creatinivorum TaxID=106004 RepID=A0A1Y2FJN6_9BASI|nr:serum paraoxonase/arylesterase [Leucosporidium creatinivorum]
MSLTAKQRLFLTIAIPFGAQLVHFIWGKASLLGLDGKEVTSLNNEKCVGIPELQGCEDAYVLEDRGLAYLACTPISSRLDWIPAMLKYNATALPVSSDNYFALLDLTTNSYQTLKIIAPSIVSDNLYLHGLDIHREKGSDLLTLFAISHRPPQDRETAAQEGANSVIEIFETTVGGKELKWVQTVEHELVRTPNSVAATGPRSFYFTNDHRRKVHWSRTFEMLYMEPSDIIYCDATSTTSDCKVAVDSVVYPNGLDLSPNGLLYSSSSAEPKISVWEIQSGDNSLVLADTIEIPYLMDNVHIAPDGTLFVPTFPKALELINLVKRATVDSQPTSAVEIYKVSTETGEKQFYGNKYKVERAFADDGSKVSGTTTSAPFKNKLLLTGVLAREVTICEIA